MYKFLQTVLIALLCLGCKTEEQESNVERMTSAEKKENTAAMALMRDADWWKERHELILSKLDSNAELILVGNSIFHTLDNEDRKEVWEDYLDKYHVINMGISGDRTENVIWRLKNGLLENINPKVAILLIGTNNTDGNHFLQISTSEELAEGIWEICSILHEKLPNTQIILMGILPYGYKPNHRDNINKATNELIAKFPEKNSAIHFVDIGSVYYDKDGKVRQDLMPDYLHPNEQGHLIMFEALEQEIAKLMLKSNSL